MKMNEWNEMPSRGCPQSGGHTAITRDPRGKAEVPEANEADPSLLFFFSFIIYEAVYIDKHHTRLEVT